MSLKTLVNGNVFQGSEFYMIGYSSGRYYTFARLNDGDSLREKDLWISDSPFDPSQPEKTKFYTFKVQGEEKPIIESFLNEAEGPVSRETTLFYDSNNEKGVSGENVVFLGNLQVPAVIDKLDSGFYTGVWYDTHLLNAGKVSVKLKNRLAAPLSTNIFAGFDENIVDYSKSLQITFIPVKGSVFHEGRCKRLANHEPMAYFTKFAREEIESSGCDKLTKESQNCIFTDLFCNNLVGFRLAKPYEKCGKRVYGPCDKGTCAYNGKKFVCVDPALLNQQMQVVGEKSKSNFWIFFIILVFFTFLAVFLLVR